jgi:hypothetical protein
MNCSLQSADRATHVKRILMPLAISLAIVAAPVLTCVILS